MQQHHNFVHYFEMASTRSYVCLYLVNLLDPSRTPYLLTALDTSAGSLTPDLISLISL